MVYIRVCVYAYTGTNTRGMVGRKKRKKKNKTKKTREQKKGVARAGVEGKNGAGGGGAGLGYTVVGNATINITYRHAFNNADTTREAARGRAKAQVFCNKVISRRLSYG